MYATRLPVLARQHKGPRINASNPLTRGLIAAVNTGADWGRDAVGGGWLSNTGAATQGVHMPGVVADYTGGSSSQWLELSVSSYPFTLAACGIAGGSGNRTLIGLFVASNDNIGYYLEFKGDGSFALTASNAANWDVATITTGETGIPLGAVAVFRSAADRSGYYMSANKAAVVSSTVSRSMSSCNRLLFGAYMHVGTEARGAYWQGRQWNQCVWNRALSDEEVWEWLRNPYQIFEPEPLAIWFGTAAGGAAASLPPYSPIRAMQHLLVR